MKKLLIIPQALILVLLFSVGCTKEEKLSPKALQQDALSKPLKQMSQEDLMVHYRNNLFSLGNMTAQLGKEEAFRKLMYEKIEQKFDGDYNVLFHHLSKATINGSPVLDKMMQASGSARVRISAENAMNAFINFDGEDFYPQIYIPFYEELKQRGKIGVSPAIIAIHPGDDNINQVPGYTLNERNELIESGIMLDEAYAKGNEVWVISLNERVHTPEENIPVENNDTNKNARTQASVYYYNFVNMRLKEHMESWLSGENDVRWTGVVNWYNERRPGSWSFDPNTPAQRVATDNGAWVWKFSKQDTQNDTWKTINVKFLYKNVEFSTTEPRYYTSGSNLSYAYGDWVWFVIFEHDAGTGVKTKGITSPYGITYNIDFRSQQGECYANSASLVTTRAPFLGDLNNLGSPDRLEFTCSYTSN